MGSYCMKKYFLLISIVLGLGISAFGQVCGGGIQTFQIFVRNGLQAENLRYQLYTVMPLGTDDDHDATTKYLNSTFFPYREPVLTKFWIKDIGVQADVAEKFISKHKPENFRREPSEEAYFKRNKYADSIKDGEFEFLSRELYDRPLLLKIFADNYRPVYLLGSHFGGCSKVHKVILDEYK